MQCAKVPLNISGVLYVLACMLSLCLACLLCADVRTSKHFPPARKENKKFCGGLGNCVWDSKQGENIVKCCCCGRKILCCKIEKCVNFERVGLYVDLEREKQKG